MPTRRVASGRKTLHKFMVALDEQVFGELDRRAETGISAFKSS